MEDQMNKYEMLLDAEKEWEPTLDHFSKLFAQRKAYGNERAANSGFKSAATMLDIPSDRTFATSKSNGNFTARDLYIESLKDSLALARVCVPTPAVLAPPNQVALVANGRGHTSRSAPTTRKCAPTGQMIVTP